jgi:shikimate dehydrogenase
MLDAALKDPSWEGGPKGEAVRLDTTAPEFEECIRHLSACGFRGVFVTNPFKVSAARMAERFFVVKHSLGVANTLLFEGGIYAQNTEVPALMESLKDVPPATALVLGAGSGARSVVMSLLELGWKVRVWNRSGMKARTILTLLRRHGQVDLVAEPDPIGCTLIVNATPLGRKIGEQPTVVWQHAKPKSVALDLVYRRVATEFLRSAAQRGFRCIDGRNLLVEQAALALQWWTTGPAPRDVMRKAAGLVRSTESWD